MSDTRTIENSLNHVVIHFEMFDGYTMFGGIDAFPTTGLGSYLRDEVTGWMEDLWKPEYTEKPPVSGVFLRESREHGFLWLPIPSFIRSFHEHGGVVYSMVTDSRNGFHTWMHPMLDRVISNSGTGFTEIPMDRMDRLRAAAVPVAVCDSEASAHRLTCDQISLLTDEVM